MAEQSSSIHLVPPYIISPWANRVAEVVGWILLRAVVSGSSAAVLRAVVVQGDIAAGAEDGLLGAAVPAHVARVVVVTGVRIGCVLRQNDWKMIQMQQDRPCRCPHCHCEKVSTFTIVSEGPLLSLKSTVYLITLIVRYETFSAEILRVTFYIELIECNISGSGYILIT